MNKKTIIKIAIGAVALVAAYQFFFCGSKCDAAEVENSWSFDAEVGYYENRIDTGVYTGEDVAYLKASTELGVLGGLAFTSAFEYVNTDDSQLYSSIGTQLTTGLGTFDVYGEVGSIENADNILELGGSYGVDIFGLQSIISATVNDSSEYSAQIKSSYLVYTNDQFNVLIGGVLGQTFETSDDYTYKLGYARIATGGDLQLFAQLNYLNSDTLAGTDGDWKATTDFGVAFSF